MKLPLTKIFFYTLVCFFIVALPLLLLHTFGYKWDPATKSLAKTGLFAIKTFPEEAVIFVDGEDTGKKTPDTLSLFPGTYELKIELENFWPYRKKVELSSNQVIRLEGILLFPKQPNSKKLLKPNAIDQMSLSPSGDVLLFLSSQGGEDNFYLLELREKTLRSLHELPEGRPLDLKNADIEWSKNEDIVAIQDPQASFILNLKALEKSFFLEDWLGKGIRLAKFSQRENSTLFVLDEDKILKLNLDDRSQTKLALESVADFQPTRSGLLIIRQNLIQVFQTDEKGRNLKLLGKLKSSISDLPLKWRSSSKRLFSLTKERWGFLDAGKKFYAWDPPLSYSGISGFQFSPSGNKALLWSDFEVWLVHRHSLERKLVYESENPLSEVFWHPEERHIFFLSEAGLHVLELDQRGGANRHLMLLPKSGFGDVWNWKWAADQELGLFYFYETTSRGEQLQVYDLVLSFLEPLMDELKDRMEYLKEKLQTSSWNPTKE